MVVTPAQFKAFLVINQCRYPYCECRLTRNHVYSRWLLSENTAHGMLVFGAGSHSAIPSNTFDADTVTHLVVTKQVWPVPPAMCDILDIMVCWGRTRSVNWHHQTLDWLHWLLKHGVNLPQQVVVSNIMEFRLREMIRQVCGDITAEERSKMMSNWQLHFDLQWIEGKDFISLAISSHNFMINCVNVHMHENRNA